ncbi:MAG: hypothetical protein HY799_11340 [Nitrosomonadales bacterium]|nr:hypothetical protein [Nitrosomonadales bacterium]
MSHLHLDSNALNRHPQKGAVFIVMLVIMIMGVIAVLVGALGKVVLHTERNAKSSDMLSQSKEALIGYAINGGSRPGDLPYQDRLATPSEANNGNYDGDQDGCAGPTGCLGRLPWRTLRMSIDSPSENDPTGVMPWYAVSANMVDPTGVTFNSELLTAFPHPWLTVRDMKGNVLSNRVAFIVFIPGLPISGKTRPSSPSLGDATQYLDSITVPAGCTAPCVPGTYSNSDANEDFISGEEHRWIDDPGNPGNQIEDTTYNFNDKLIYITIDELMPLIEKRVGGEIRSLLKTYYSAWGRYPFAATFNDPSVPSNFKGKASPATYSGLLPVDDQSYLPTWAAIPTISFDGAISGGPMNCILSNDVGGGNYSRWRCCKVDYTDTPPSCLNSDITIPAGVTVTVTGNLDGVGLGFWRPHNINDICEVRARNSSGTSVLVTSLFAPNSVSIVNSLNADGSAQIQFTATGKAGNTVLERIELRDIRSYNTDIENNSNTGSCSNTPASPVIPKWLFDESTYGNNWHKVAYYSMSSGYAPNGANSCTPLGIPSCLTVNGNSSVNNNHAVVIMTSGELAGLGQTHPQSTVTHYLEDENASSNFIFENKARSSSFNDQVIVVAP